MSNRFHFALTLQRLSDLRPTSVRVIRPDEWRQSGEASYEVLRDAVYMRGPNYIYTEIECLPLRRFVEFSAVIRRADNATIGLYFCGADGQPFSEIISYVGFRNSAGSAAVHGKVPVAAASVRAFVHSPTWTDEVVLKQCALRMSLWPIKVRPSS